MRPNGVLLRLLCLFALNLHARLRRPPIVLVLVVVLVLVLVLDGWDAIARMRMRIETRIETRIWARMKAGVNTSGWAAAFYLASRRACW
jgi:hypothetical protein